LIFLAENRGSEMKLFDEKFMKNKVRFGLQCSLATLSVFIVLLLIDAMSNAVVIAVFGASAFIAFTMPEAGVSRPRYLIGGYLVGITAGSLCRYLLSVPLLESLPFFKGFPYVAYGSLAVGVATFGMVITDTEHPPAAGLALGLVLNECSFTTVLVVLTGIVSLSIIKTALRPFLRNLL
jgi:CBS-domain-containing membrane protein